MQSFDRRHIPHPTQSTIEKLPYDILETIIQELAEESGKESKEKETLSACSLTCRAFVHPCRTHLFSSIDFSTYSPGHSPHLILQKPSLAAHCRTLVFRLGPSQESEDTAAALLQLKRIRSFTLDGRSPHGWNALSPAMQQAFIHLFGLPSLTNVTIGLDGIPLDEGLPAILLSSCRNLVDLNLDGFRTAFTSACCLANLGPPPRPLSLSSRYLDPVMKSLLDIRRSETVPIIDLSHVRRLTVECDNDGEYKIFEKILLMARTLEFLDCEVSAPVTYHNLAQMLDLKSMRLMKLRFSVDDEMHDLFAGLIEELEEMSQQKNTSLQELLLDLIVERDTKCRFIDREWKKFDDIIGNPSTFPNLYSFTFKITLATWAEYDRSEEQLEMFEEMKARHLPRLSSRDSQEFHFDFSVEIVLL
ncbi:hypothetical protein B0H34DRAFT_476957 [Crassisporium funariophilum]|nr:hypothetical protein B0H34DRAFT_476957 [Crassisporium funariophilum]